MNLWKKLTTEIKQNTVMHEKWLNLILWDSQSFRKQCMPPHCLLDNRLKSKFQQKNLFFQCQRPRTPCYRVVCCAFLSRALVCMFRNSNLIWVSPYINICYAAITIYISRHLFHLNLFNYDNCTGLLWAKTKSSPFKRGLMFSHNKANNS